MAGFLSANGEALLVQQDSISGPEFDAPITRGLGVNGLAAVRAIAAHGVRANEKVDRLAQAIAAIPPMLDGGICR